MATRITPRYQNLAFKIPLSSAQVTSNRAVENCANVVVMPCWILLPLVKKRKRMKRADPRSDNAEQHAGSNLAKQELGPLHPKSIMDGVVHERKE